LSAGFSIIDGVVDFVFGAGRCAQPEHIINEKTISPVEYNIFFVEVIIDELLGMLNF